MPHVIITGAVGPRQAAGALGAAMERTADLILKTKQAYLSTNGEELLVEGLVVDHGKSQNLLGLVQQRPDGVVVRLSPFMDEVEKTEAVQHFVAWLGQRVHDANPGTAYGATNLERFLSIAPAA